MHIPLRGNGPVGVQEACEQSAALVLGGAQVGGRDVLVVQDSHAAQDRLGFIETETLRLDEHGDLRVGRREVGSCGRAVTQPDTQDVGRDR